MISWEFKQIQIRLFLIKLMTYKYPNTKTAVFAIDNYFTKKSVSVPDIYLIGTFFPHLEMLLSFSARLGALDGLLQLLGVSLMMDKDNQRHK